jgi:hypothetical protein
MATSKEIKEKVVAFRLTEAQHAELKEYFDKHPVGGIRSVNTFCRKLALDVSHDRITWRNKKEATLSPESILALEKMKNGNGSGKKAKAVVAA